MTNALAMSQVAATSSKSPPSPMKEPVTGAVNFKLSPEGVLRPVAQMKKNRCRLIMQGSRINHKITTPCRKSRLKKFKVRKLSLASGLKVQPQQAAKTIRRRMLSETMVTRYASLRKPPTYR